MCIMLYSFHLQSYVIFLYLQRKKEIIAPKSKTALARLRCAGAVAVVRKEVPPPS